jgi:hypothetical protein
MNKQFSKLFTLRLSGIWQPYVVPCPAIHLCLARNSQQSSIILKKQSRTPFIIFSGDKIGDLKKANPGVRMPDLSRMLGQMWRLLSDQQKEIYRLRYQDEKEIFMAKKKVQLDSLSEEQKSMIVKQANEKRRKKVLQNLKKLKKELHKPKAADVNPFVLYFQSKVLDRGDAPISQYMKGLSEHWKMMPIESKQPFIDKARANSILYHQKLSEWESNMISQGHSNLLRRSAFRRLTKKRKGTSLKLKEKNDSAGANTSVKFKLNTLNSMKPSDSCNSKIESAIVYDKASVSHKKKTKKSPRNTK